MLTLPPPAPLPLAVPLRLYAHIPHRTQHSWEPPVAAATVDGDRMVLSPLPIGTSSGISIKLERRWLVTPVAAKATAGRMPSGL